MIQKFVDRFMEHKEDIRKCFTNEHPESYLRIIQIVVRAITDPANEWEEPDPNRIHCINDGDYQGTLLFIIGSGDYQPDEYWYVKVCYGSCSGCDTLQSIQGYEDGPPTEYQIDDYMTLALHIVQGLKKME